MRTIRTHRLRERMSENESIDRRWTDNKYKRIDLIFNYMAGSIIALALFWTAFSIYALYN